MSGALLRPPTPAVGQADTPEALSPFTVLLIDEFQPSRPLWQEFVNALTGSLTSVSGRRVVFFQENLDERHLSEVSILQESAGWYLQKYRERPIDLIIVQGRGSTATGLSLRQTLGDSIPLIRLVTEPDRPDTPAAVPRLPSTATILLGRAEVALMRFIMQVRPGTREIALIVDTPMEADALLDAIRPALPRGVRLSVLLKPTLASLERDLPRLDPTAVVFFFNLMTDGDGSPWIPADFVAAFAPTAARPVFSIFHTFLGRGVIGGPVVDSRRLGATVANLAATVLEGARPDSLPTLVFNDWPVPVDWEQLKRHGMSQRDLPQEAVVLNRPPWPWESYPRTSLTITLLLGALVFATMKSRRDQRLLRRARDARSELSQRLMRLQDEERSRIARDLHDDLCQRMTVLALDLDRAATPPALAEGAAPGDRVRELIRRTQDITRDLHSVRLSMTELPDAVIELVASLRGRTDLPITVEAESWPSRLPTDLTTTAYRVVQEALQNVIRHAGASECQVVLSKRGRSLQVAIRDDGVGFSENTGEPQRIGLLSMRERAASMGGSLRIDSRPYEGTTVTLSFPLPEGM